VLHASSKYANEALRRPVESETVDERMAAERISTGQLLLQVPE
jgi:hypothetical protein